MLVATAVPLVSAAGTAAQEPPATVPDLRVIVLVDESGSIGDADLVAEQEAARTIAASALSPGSVVSVVGFGSSEKPGQSAVDVVCPPTKVDSGQNRDLLAKCVSGLRKRADSEGDGTDHVAALQQALDFVRADGPEKKVVFLLTDGKLDVSSSPSWGNTPERRNRAAADKVGDVLSELDRAGAQVWPLGFGSVDLGALAGFAKGKSCAPAVPDPREQVVSGPEAIQSAIKQAFSSATCGKYNTSERGDVPKGGSLDLTVDIPAVASDASIIVSKRDARVQVEYWAPGAGKPAPQEGAANFVFSGQSTETESVQITDPKPGRWTIRLSSAEVDARDVVAAVFFQAAVKAYLTVTPTQPTAGQTVEATMQVRAREAAINDPEVLRGLAFVVTLTGHGFQPAQIALSDPDGDGAFTGKLDVPAGADGELTYTGQVSGVGVGGDTRTLSTRVRAEAAPVQAQILYDDNRATVVPGGSVTGSVSVANNSGKVAQLRLEVVDVTAGTTLTVDPAQVRADPGAGRTAFTLRFGADSPLGGAGAKLRLVDTADGTVVTERLFSAEITPEPSAFEEFFWIWILLAALALAGLVWVLLRLRARAEANRVTGLRAQLHKNDFLAAELPAPDGAGRDFGFIVHDDFTGPQLQPAGPDEANAYWVRRVGDRLELRGPTLPPAVIPAGVPRHITQDTAIVILDDRAAAVIAAPPADPFGSPATASFGAPAGFTGPPADPFAQTATVAAPTAQYPTAPSTTNPDPFGDPFGTPSYPSGPGPQPGPAAAPERGPQIDPYNPFA
ncbi:von Willebrand factor type A domain-containing protein [Actinokineospora auranticolor]|uniref:von Willebrand factor type A domain-containing protein n=1 Tax=Actinokineospora auranticolor TaxID=155976 RepID=A0A2S6GF77_9PSEU|nr:von Willebrand factor type A domain-containing protein [Actinokineospora auranticolor]